MPGWLLKKDPLPPSPQGPRKGPARAPQGEGEHLGAAYYLAGEGARRVAGGDHGFAVYENVDYSGGSGAAVLPGAAVGKRGGIEDGDVSGPAGSQETAVAQRE